MYKDDQLRLGEFTPERLPRCFELDAERAAERRDDYAEWNDEREVSERSGSEFLQTTKCRFYSFAGLQKKKKKRDG